MRPAKSIKEVAERVAGGGIEIKRHDPKEGRQTFRSVITDLLIDKEIRRNLDFVVRSMILRSRGKK